MKLSDYAKKKGISYRTAWRWFKAGLIKGYQMPTGTIIVISARLYGLRRAKEKANKIRQEVLGDV